MPEKDATQALVIKRLDVQALIQQAVDKDAGVEILERLLALAKDVRAEQAREAWNQAMAQFQRDCPAIIKTESAKIGNKFSYKYASLEGVMGSIIPVMNPLGLSVSWRHRWDSGKVSANCRITHEMGHFEESGDVMMPIPEDGSGASAPQRIGIAMTYAKRYSLIGIIGIAPEEDSDGSFGVEPKPEFRKVADLGDEETDEPEQPELPVGDGVKIISEAQHKRLWAIAFRKAKEFGKDANEMVGEACKSRGFKSSKAIPVNRYNEIVADIEAPF